MNHTTNYQLSQWSASDRVQRVDFNADNAKIDAALAGLQSAVGTIPKIAVGHYVGDGAASRIIPLDFTPKAVYVCNQSGYTYYDNGSASSTHGGLAVTDQPVNSAVVIVNGGFKVALVTSSHYSVCTNVSNTKYNYIAFA